MSSYMDKWTALADTLISIVAVKPDAWIAAIDAGVTYEDIPAGAWREAYTAIMALRSDPSNEERQKRALGDAEIATECGPAVSVQWIAERIGLYDSWQMSTFDDTARRLQLFGRGSRSLAHVRGMLTELEGALNNGLRIDEALDNGMSALQLEQAPARVTAVDVADIGKEVEAEFDAPPSNTIKTGIPIFDHWTGGLLPEEMVAWVGPTKQRKTSASTQAIITMARAGVPLNFFSFDESRKRVYYRFMAVLMAEYMWNTRNWDLTDAHGAPLNNVSRKMLMQAGDSWRGWPKTLQDARIYAKDQLEKMRGIVRVYDSKTCSRTPKSIRSICLTDAAKLGGLGAIFIDHIQKLAGYDTIFAQVQDGSSRMHSLKEELGCIMWVLSQQNVDAIKRGDGGDWDPNVKGGGGLTEVSDTIIVSNYKFGTVTDPNYLRINLRQGREDESGSYGYTLIHPASGWIPPRLLTVDEVLQKVNMQDLQDAAIGPRE